MKSKPYIFLLVLVAILIFILGVRYGQKVEKANKTINYLISLPPTKMPSPPPIQGYKAFSHKGCGVSFLYPELFVIEKNSSQEAQLTYNKSQILYFTCFPTNITRPPIINMWKKQFQNQEIIIHGSKQLEFMLLNRYSKQYITLSVEEKFYPLLEKTLEFISPTP